MNQKNIKYWLNVQYYFKNGDTVLLEVWFGLQAIGTGVLSLYLTNDLTGTTIIFMWMNVVFAIPQIVLAFSNNYFHRHWSNWITFLLSMCVSVSLIDTHTDQIAIFGYGFLSLATLHAAFLVNAKMHNEKSKKDGQ